MNQFLNKEITEKELIKNIKTKITKKNIETLYVMSAYIHKDHRTKGIATNTIIKMISYYQKEYENIELFAWTFSEQGKKLFEKIKKITNLKGESITKN